MPLRDDAWQAEYAQREDASYRTFDRRTGGSNFGACFSPDGSWRAQRLADMHNDTIRVARNEPTPLRRALRAASEGKWLKYLRSIPLWLEEHEGISATLEELREDVVREMAEMGLAFLPR
jgi:hypothetical protein